MAFPGINPSWFRRRDGSNASFQHCGFDWRRTATAGKVISRSLLQEINNVLILKSFHFDNSLVIWHPSVFTDGKPRSLSMDICAVATTWRCAFGGCITIACSSCSRRFRSLRLVDRPGFFFFFGTEMDEDSANKIFFLELVTSSPCWWWWLSTTRPLLAVAMMN